jgi:signal transduction histidine kinase
LAREPEEQIDEKVDLVATITHELKTSLTAIIASAELLADELHPGDEESPHWKLIQSIIRNAHRLNERVSYFAELPRQPMETFEFKPEPVEIKEILNNVVTRLHPRIQARRQSLTTKLPDSLPRAHADKQHLEQIMLTLVSNASKFSPEGGKIEVSSWRYDSASLVVRISDTCGGIPLEEQERIFRPHYQIKRTNGKGGLGLAIAKFLVELHEGKIWVKSQMGHGCSFFFTIPLAREVK